MKSLIVILALAGGCALGAGSVARAENAQTQQQVVQYRVSDLATPQGLRRLYNRLNEAASTVCGQYASPDLLHTAPYHRCLAEAVSRAVSQIHDERLTRYHDSRTNSGAPSFLISSAAP
jgi:UrcA family protein